jgi:lipopolysaccharide/colanic/teichoic acid biosynthesis glycosyltransferase
MYEITKRIMDLILGILFLLFILPILLIIALVILIEDGEPILYRSIRVGRNGKPFMLYKFRTMVKVADEKKNSEYVQKLLSGELGPERGNALYKLSNDPRITKVGRFIRKYNLEELPQFFNIIEGNMSLVGPRAALPYEVNVYEVFQKRRFEAKPGITGIWQIQGRSQVTFNEMIQLDIEYIDRRSILLDIEILFATIPIMLFAKGAS